MIARNFLSAAAMLTLTCAPAASAGLLDGVAKGFAVLGGTSGLADPSKVMSFDELDSQLSSLSTTFISALRSMLTAQAITMSAIGMKDKSAALTSEAKSLEGKNDLNTVKRSITVSQEASKEIDDKLTQSTVVDTNAKMELTKAIPHYTQGIQSSVLLPSEYSNWGTNATSSVNALKNNPVMALQAGRYIGKVNEVLGVTGELPSLISSWKTTTSNFINFSKQNKIDTGDLASKI